MKTLLTLVLTTCAGVLFADDLFHFIEIDPGHFHAALVLNRDYPEVAKEVAVFAPKGPEIDAHAKLVEGFNVRAKDPTAWKENIYRGDDYLAQFRAFIASGKVEAKKCIVVLAGRNDRKADYCLEAVKAGCNVLSDKPMAITPEDLEKVRSAAALAREKGLLFSDIMTERNEITTILQKAFVNDAALYGEQVIEAKDPWKAAVTKESVHHISNFFYGKHLSLPTWYYDTTKQGEGIVDVTTHLVDLVQWELFDGQMLDFNKVEIVGARMWPTEITPEQYELSTGVKTNQSIFCAANGEFVYRLNGVSTKISVVWNFMPRAGSGDTHYSLMRGTKAKVEIRQDATTGYKPVLFVSPTTAKLGAFEEALKTAIAKIGQTWTGVSAKPTGVSNEWRISYPASYDIGHEAHFSQVVREYLGWMKAGAMPEERRVNLLVKYETLVAAREAAHHAPKELRALTPCARQGWWMKRHDEKLALVRQGGAPIVFLGDSITHYWEGAGKDIWDMYFSDGRYRAIDLGYSGDRTEHVLWRLDHGELDGYEAKAVVLMIGTNNTGHFPVDQETPIDTICGISAVIQKIQEKQPTARIVLHPIFPRGGTASSADRRRNEAVNREIMRLADGRKVIWCDFNQQLLCGDGLLPREIMPDLLHPAPWGYRIWANAVLPILDQILDGKEVIAGRFAERIDPSQISGGTARCTTPVSAVRFEGATRFPSGYLPRMLAKRRQIISAPQGEIDLVFVGDSITHYWEYLGAKPLYDDLQKTYSVLNLGYGGETTQGCLWHLQNGELDGFKAKCVMLMIGTNNNDRDDKFGGIKACLEVIRAKQPQAKVLLLPIFPRGADETDPRRQANEKANEKIRTLADGQQVIWVDFNKQLVDAKGDTLPLMADRLHPTLEGYRVWLNAVRPYFQKIIGK